MKSRRLIATIALLGYLLGGWLLPVTHDHAAHSGDACGHVHAVVATATAGGEASADGAHDCCCHDENSAHAAGKTPAAGRSSERRAQGLLAQSVAQDNGLVAGGLCVLCQLSTRLISVAVPRCDASHKAAVTRLVRLPERPAARSLRLSVEGPRGPPAGLV